MGQRHPKRLSGHALALAATTSFFLGLASPAQAAFAYSKALTIDNLLVTGPADLVNFPVLVSVTLPPAHVTSPLGYDIIFRAEDVATCGGASPCRLDHEIESYNSGTGALVAWVRLPVLRTAADTVIYVYYGDAAVTCRQENKTGVWDANYREVFHLKETGDYTDSTVNGFTAVTKGTVNQGVAGLFGTAADFVGPAASRLIVSDGILTANSPFTMESWVRMDTLQSGQFVGIYTKGRDSNTDWVGLYKINTDRAVLGWQCCAPPGKPGNLNGPVMVAGAWYHLVATYDGAGTNRRLYVNGVQVATDTLATYPTIPQYTRVGDDSNGQYLDGQVDELRFSNVERSADWIQTTYNNLNSPGTFYKTIGAEDPAPPPVIVTCPAATASACAGGDPAAGVCNLRSIGSAGNYNAGNVSVTNGSNVVTGVGGTLWVTNNRGRGDRLRVLGVDYTVASVDSETELRLTTPYAGATNPSRPYTLARQFGTLQAWEDCISFGVACTFFPVTSANLITDNRSETGIVYKDGAYTNGAAIVLSFDGTTTDAAHTITLTADPGNRHNGIPGSGVVVNNGATNGNVAIDIRDEYVTVEWLEVTGGQGAGSHGIQIHPNIQPGNHVTVSHNLVHNTLGNGIRYFAPDAIADIFDNFVYRCTREGLRIDSATQNPGSRLRVMNNTFLANAGAGLAEVFGTVLPAFPLVTLRNNILVDDAQASDFVVPWLDVGSSHNITGDAAPATGPFTPDLGPNPRAGGVYSATEASLNFVNRLAGTENLHIQTGSTAIDAAANLGGLFPDDIDGAGRAAPWDVGADDFASPVPQGAGCPAGTFWAGPNLIANGDLSVAPPAGFTTGVAYTGLNVKPFDTSIALQTGHRCYDFGGTPGCPNVIDQLPFGGDPVMGSPAVNSWLYANGNLTGAPYMIWQQQVGVSANTTYVFYFYVSNALAPGSVGIPDLAIPQLFRDGSTTSPFTPQGTQVGTNASVPNETTAQGDFWTRFQYVFTTGAAQTTTVLSIWDAATGNNGDDIGLAQVGMRACRATTAVTLQSFTATGADGAVDLAWATASELDNLGFHLYRSTSAQGPFERITAAPIPGLGSSPTGAGYAYRDPGLVNGQVYFYELEDLETTGRTERHGPVSVVPTGEAVGSSPDPGEGNGSADGPSGGSGARTAYGQPEETSLQIVERGPTHAVVELVTPGFYAVVEPDGTHRFEVPGFESGGRPGAPAVPVKRTFVESVAGRRVRITSVVSSDEVRFTGLEATAEGAPDLVVTERGMVEAGRKRQVRDTAAWRPGLVPRQLSQLLGVTFQGETKKARLELAPLRYDPVGRTVVLARRLRVRLDFVGVDHRETALGGSRGRKVRAPALRATGVQAELVAREAGLYAVRFEDVFTGRRGQPAASLRLSRQGQPVAYHLEPDRASFGPGSMLYFLSEGGKANPWGDAVYQLQLGQPAVTMPVISGSPSGPPVSEYLAAREWEQNRFYQAGLLEATDLWLWDLLISPVTKSYPLTLNQLAASSTYARLTVWLQGASDFEGISDHHVRVMVNSTPVGEASWDGKTEKVIEAEVLPGILQEGANTIALENVADTGATSMVFLNRFSLRYPRKLVAENEGLDGSFEQSGTAEVSGLASGFVVDTQDAQPGWLGGVAATPAGLSFRAEVGRSYRVVSAAGTKRAIVRKPSKSSLRSRAQRADWLLVAPRELLGAAEPLAALRRRQGLAVKLVSMEDVAQVFGHGEASPSALKEFLEYAYQSWRRPSIKYVVLLGDGSYDPKDYLQTGTRDWIPPFILKTSYLWTASDPAYGSVNGDDLLPDLAIGRLPAGTVEQARILVDKIVAFETAGRRLGGRAILIADNADQGGDFEAGADDLAASVLGGRAVDKVYLRDLGAGTRPTILSAFDAGAGLISYSGHGGTAVWASENVFNNLDVPDLAPQGEQPLLLTMNCLNGFFHFPPFDSLAEALVKAEGKGAIAAFAPSGLSLHDAAHAYERAVLAEIESGRHRRLGDAILAGQSVYADSGSLPELLSVYHLLGDPALRIRP